MLSWLCVLAKPLGTHAKASLPCSPLPLHQSLLFPLIFAKEHLSLALLAPPVAPSLSIPTAFSKAHQPLRPAPRPCLPSKKVRCCHPKKFGRLPEGLLPIRTINEIFRTIPSTKLASLVKGEVLSPEKILATTEGIAPYPHQSLLFPLIFAKEHLSLALLAPPVAPSLSIPTAFSKAHQPLRPAPRPCLPSKKVRCCHPKKFGRLPEGLLSYRTNSSQNRTIPRLAPSPLPPLSKGGGLTARHKP